MARVDRNRIDPIQGTAAAPVDVTLGRLPIATVVEQGRLCVYLTVGAATHGAGVVVSERQGSRPGPTVPGMCGGEQGCH
jgi:hypothetical protein